MGRTIAIGDIHGCSTAFVRLVELLNPQLDDTVVPLGDYVDRGPDSKRVLDQLIELSTQCRLVPILGNHDEMMLHAREGKSDLQFWLKCGGEATLDSYRPTGWLDSIPKEHFEFLKSCVPFFETETHIFTHANYKPDLPFARQDNTHCAGCRFATTNRPLDIVRARPSSLGTRRKPRFSTGDFSSASTRAAGKVAGSRRSMLRMTRCGR